MSKATKGLTLTAALLMPLLLLAPAGCDEPEDCPQGAELTGDELSCECGGETVDALPGDGSICVCDPDEGLVCEMPTPSCELDVAFDGEELPCLCDGDTIEALPGDGSECRCDATEGFVCEQTFSGTECPIDVELNGEELPCACGEETIDALPGDGSACRCDETDGFVCDPMDSSSGS